MIIDSSDEDIVNRPSGSPLENAITNGDADSERAEDENEIENEHEHASESENIKDEDEDEDEAEGARDCTLLSTCYASGGENVLGFRIDEEYSHLMKMKMKAEKSVTDRRA